MVGLGVLEKPLAEVARAKHVRAFGKALEALCNKNPKITKFTKFPKNTKYELCILYILQKKNEFFDVHFSELPKLQNMNYGTYT